MDELLSDLLVSDVAEICDTNVPLLKSWIDEGLVTAPPIVGRHRRFGAANTVEVLLMTELNALGIKPSTVASWLRMISFDLVRWIGEHVVADGDGVRLTEECLLTFWLTRRNCISVGRPKDLSAPIGGLPQHTFVFNFGRVLVTALERAIALPERARA